MLLMIQRYLKEGKAISLAFIDIGIKDTLNYNDCSNLRELSDAIAPLKLGSEKYVEKMLYC